MHLHEYQAKAYLKKFGVAAPEHVVISSLEDAEKIKINKGVVKVQIHAGGRGKAGGVSVAKTSDELLKSVKALLGKRFVTPQTSNEGLLAIKVIIDSLVDIEKEYYLAALIDRKRGEALLVAAKEGGMQIEELALEKPESIMTIPIQLDGTIRPYHLVKLAKFMGWALHDENAMSLVKGLARAFVASDASLIEINPLVRTKEGALIALDSKMTVDDNALFRQEELKICYDPSQVSEPEAKAYEHELAYVSLEGTIGCMVNGAGLAMATMDIIKYYGGSPANFLDVGGGASEEKVALGFELILADPQVKAILVNIFGGIMNCQTIAAGIIAVANRKGIPVPLVVRLEGTDVDKGKKMLAESGLNITVANTLAEAAERAVQTAK